MKIFWSWQADSPARENRTFIKNALEEAIKQIAVDLALDDAERPQLDHDTKGEAGWVEIVATILQKIEDDDAFVGDVTPIARTEGGKLLPNPNVMMELGYALKAKGPGPIVLVVNKAGGIRTEELPFDTRHRRGPIMYELASDASDKQRAKVCQALSVALADALSTNLKAALKGEDSKVQFALAAARDGNLCTWLPFGAQIVHQDSFKASGETKWTVSEGDPKAYLRVIPAGWRSEKPSRLAVHGVGDNHRLWAFGRWSTGDHGLNDLGVVMVGMNPLKQDEVLGATQWFDKTGEIWGFTTGISEKHDDGKVLLAQYDVLRAWAESLEKYIKFLKRFDAAPPFRIEAGVCGLKDVFWSGRLSFERSKSVDADATYQLAARGWGPDEQLTFLTNSYNRLCDAFGRERLNEEQVNSILEGMGLVREQRN